MARSWATRPQGSSREPRCTVEGRSERLVACRIGEARRAARLFTRNRAHRHVGCPPKYRLVNHDERRPYRWNSGTRVSDSGPILRHRSGPSSQLSGPIADSWRVLQTRKDSDSHPPPPTGGASGLHRTQFRKRKKFKIRFLEFLCFPFLLDCLDTSRTEQRAREQ